MKQPELISEHRHTVTLGGQTYDVSVWGEQRRDGTWSGWLEFRNKRTNETLRTGQETSQPNRMTLEYWATGIEDIYLEGAFDRIENPSRSR